ncbi:hypothetical protein C8R45DRAFT_928847 [Mycena sanguinolenta]|nr:hypothetical protein C8R45DRAFT_928847 [Mycena sanguinolenta]
MAEIARIQGGTEGVKGEGGKDQRAAECRQLERGDGNAMGAIDRKGEGSGAQRPPRKRRLRGVTWTPKAKMNGRYAYVEIESRQIYGENGWRVGPAKAIETIRAGPVESCAYSAKDDLGTKLEMVREGEKKSGGCARRQTPTSMIAHTRLKPSVEQSQAPGIFGQMFDHNAEVLGRKKRLQSDPKAETSTEKNLRVRSYLVTESHSRTQGPIHICNELADTMRNPMPHGRSWLKHKSKQVRRNSTTPLQNGLGYERPSG